MRGVATTVTQASNARCKMLHIHRWQVRSKVHLFGGYAKTPNLPLDETYVKVRGKWMYLYRAVDSTGQTIDFLLNETRSTRAAKRFFRKMLGRPKVTSPRVINVDKNPAYIGAVRDLKQEDLLPVHCKRRPSQYMNNMVEQDHRFLKRKIKPGLGFGSYPTAWRTIQGYETMHMIRKGQIEGAEKGNIRAQNQLIASLFGAGA